MTRAEVWPQGVRWKHGLYSALMYDYKPLRSWPIDSSRPAPAQPGAEWAPKLPVYWAAQMSSWRAEAM